MPPRFDKETVEDAMRGRFLDFYSQFSALEKSGGEWRGPCPIHHGDSPNFTVDADTGEWFCHSACGEGGDVFKFVEKKDGLRFGDAILRLAEWARVPSLPPPAASKPRIKRPRGPVVASFDYIDEDGKLLYQVQRHEPGADGRAKDFVQRRPDGQGGWIYNLTGVRRVLYHLPEVLAAARSGRRVYVCEGEKAADALRALGLTATTNSGGAKNWESGLTAFLAGACVVILPDNDGPGREHARAVAADVRRAGICVRIVALPGLPEKGDAVEWLAAGGTRDALAEMADAAPEADADEDAPPPLEPEDAAGYDFRKTMPQAPFSLRDGSVWIARSSGRGETTTAMVLPHRLHIAGRTHDLDTDVESVTLVWDRDKQWKRRTVAQRVVASTREIVTLADASLLVNSGNARDVVAFVAHLLGTHKDSIPITRAVSSCGWKDAGGKAVFMWGTQPITGEKEAPAITFVPETPESQELTAAMRPGGTLEGWVAMARRLADHPLPAFGVAASFLSPLLGELAVGQNPIFDFAGASSSGKTTAMKLGASVWGYAPENEGGLIRSWNSTAVFLERLANTSAGLPIFLDESHVAKPESVQQALYQLANGTGKGRGAMAGGTQRTAKYRSVVFSAGEMKLTQASEFEGAAARVVSFWGSPFGKGQGDLVRSLTQEALTHFGQAGPHVLRAYMTKREERRAQLREIQKDSAARLQDRVSDPIGERLVPVFAAVEAAGIYASELLGLDWDMEAITDAAFAKATESRPVSSMQQALDQVVSWADGNPQHIAGAGYDEERPSELAGYSRADGALGLLPDRLRRLLAERRFAYESTLANWADAGWIECDAKQQRHTKVVKVLGKSVRMVLLTPLAAALARGQAEAEDAAGGAEEQGEQVTNR